MRIKSVFIWVSIITLLGIFSCANDSEEVGGSKEEFISINNDLEKVASVKSGQPNSAESIKLEELSDDVEKDNIANSKNNASTSSVVEKTVTLKAETSDAEISKTKIVEKSNKKESIIDKKIVSEPSERISEKSKEEKKVISKEEEIYLSAELDLSVDRNQQYNPDNANALLDLERESKITIVPIFSEKDLGLYYVQFLESAIKLNKSDLATYLNQECKVFVVFHQGLYKYSVFQSENEENAKAAMKIFDSNCGDNESSVTTYKSDW